MDSFRYHPNSEAWVFQDMSDPNSVKLAKVASHEAGHMFGLGHDGYKTEKTWNDYHAGITDLSWGPIMGSPVFFPEFMTWNNGTYDKATNQQDDAKTMGDRIHFRPEDRFDFVTSSGGKVTYPSISLDKTYYSFLAPRPTGKEAKMIKEGEWIDVDYFSFKSSGNKDLEIIIENIFNSPNAIYKAAVYSKSPRSALILKDNISYNFKTSKFFLSLGSQVSLLSKL